jgi:hypothetical protein
MKTKDSLLKMLIVSLLLISIIWELALFVTSPGTQVSRAAQTDCTYWNVVLDGIHFL